MATGSTFTETDGKRWSCHLILRERVSRGEIPNLLQRFGIVRARQDEVGEAEDVDEGDNSLLIHEGVSRVVGHLKIGCSWTGEFSRYSRARSRFIGVALEIISGSIA